MALTLDSAPSDNRVTESRSVTVSTPAVVPTTGNTEVKLTNDAGQAATVDSVTGSDPYVINYTFPRTTAKKFDAVGYPIYVEVAAENVTSSNVPFLPVTTQRFIDLSSPVATVGTYGAIYAGATAATGDQRVHDIVSTSESISLDADGAAYGAEQDFWAIRSQPTATQTATFYLIQADGTVDVEDTITFVVGAVENRFSTRDVQHSALLLTGGVGATRDMEHGYWLGVFGGSGSTADILYEGIIIGLGMQDLKEYYDTQTSTVWVDFNTSEKAYWLKIIADNI